MYYFRSDLEKRKLPTINVPHSDLMMCLNESELDSFQAIKAKLLERLESVHLNRYFSEVTDELAVKLAEYIGFGVTPDCISWGNGADEMLYYLFAAVRGDWDSYAASLAPSYFDYKTYCNAVGMQAQFMPLNPDFSFDADEYIKRVNQPQCRLAILCNPNNPTGNLLDTTQIERVISETNKPVLIDETYFEFSGVTWADRLQKYPNLVLIRSFSKAFSSAGLRFGYMISSKENMHEIKKVMTHFHTGILSQAFALTILENKNLFLNHNKAIIRNRDMLFNQLEAIQGLTALNTHTNFLLFSAGERSLELYEALQNDGIAVRDIGKHPLTKNYLRVTVASEKSNGVFLESVKKFFKA